VKVTALAAHSSEAVRAALAARGVSDAQAALASAGLETQLLLFDELADPEREALLRWSAHSGGDLLSGAGWALLQGTTSRLAALARPERLTPELQPVALAVAHALAAHGAARSWSIAGAEFALERPVLLGVINATPDSFSDGGHFLAPDRALARAERLRADGSDLLDVGGESTRPGAEPVSAAVEIARVVPVIEALGRRGLGPISVDTRRSEVARAAIEAGAAVVNDVSGGRFDTSLLALVGQAGVGVILTHMRGTPETMDAQASYGAVALEVAGELRETAARAEGAGIARRRIALDPGFGFAKVGAQNFRLLDELAAVAGLGYPVAVGPSRKRFLGHATGRPVEDRDRATAVACALAWERGARIFRVHDVALAREALAVAAATASPM